MPAIRAANGAHVEAALGAAMHEENWRTLPDLQHAHAGPGAGETDESFRRYHSTFYPKTSLGFPVARYIHVVLQPRAID
jgi:hypothetical protein